MAAIIPGESVICYRMGLVRVTGVGPVKVIVKDPYGVVQSLDWDDVREYNRRENYNWEDTRLAWLERVKGEVD